MNLSYGSASPADTAVIFALAKELIARYEDPQAIDLARALQWTRRKIENHIAEYSRVYYNGETAGFFHFAPCENGMELDDLYILPQFRNLGIGTAVVKRCISQAHGPIELYVFTQNTGALGLYRRLGFEITQQVSPTRMILRREVP